MHRIDGIRLKYYPAINFLHDVPLSDKIKLWLIVLELRRDLIIIHICAYYGPCAT